MLANVAGTVEVTRQRIVNVELHFSSKWSLILQFALCPCNFRFGANEGMCVLFSTCVYGTALISFAIYIFLHVANEIIIIIIINIKDWTL
jgi:hypothetical protein